VGADKQIAKAVALEAMRVAHAERRPCRLYLWSGRDQVAEHELSLDSDGVAALLEFLGLSFCGGTDAETVLRCVLERVAEEAWSRADLLIVSDGEFPVPGETAEALKTVRAELGFRVQGVLIGNASSPGMDAVCDAVANFRDWAAVVA
jgi:uncharacterized protein with von Willebrand factor type A (vWA) domain